MIKSCKCGFFFSNSRGKIVKSVTNECKNPSDDASQNMLDFVLDRFAVNDRSRIGKLIRGLEVAELTEDWFEEVYQEHTDEFWQVPGAAAEDLLEGILG